MSLLVLTGATITFEQLITEVTLDPFVSNLKKLGIHTFNIQYGNEPLRKSELFFEGSIKNSKLKLKYQTSISNDSQTVFSYSDNKLKINAFPFSASISDIIEKNDIVISHAGTGSIIDVLKHDKPLIVVVNESLMDNHQIDVAQEFSSLGHCIVSKISQLSETLKSILDEEVVFTQFESSKSKIIQEIVYNEAST